jgi:hypothetical protein
MSDIIMQHLRTTNDTNGNPRRLYVFYGRNTGDYVGIVDEGYSGRPRAQPGIDILELNSVDITPKQYRELKREIPRLEASCLLSNFIVR